MKTAISIPDNVFTSAESLAQRLGMSRSEFYSKAVAEYVKAHSEDGVTELLNEVYSSSPDSTLENELHKLQLKSLAREEW